MKTTLWITRTAILVALLVILQAVTKSFGQFVTGSCVNLILAIAASVGGLWCGVTVACISPFAAYLFGIGTPFLQIVPLIAVGNLVYVLLISLFCDKLNRNNNRILPYVGIVAASVVKFAVLYLLVVQLAIPLIGMPDKQAMVIGASFSWPQLVTGLIGGVVAVSIAPLLKKITIRAK